MKKILTFLTFVVILFLYMREYVPYVSSRTSVTITIPVLLFAYALFIFQSYHVSRKYLFLFSIPLANTLFSLFSYSGGGFDVQVYSLMQVFIWTYVSEYLQKSGKDKYAGLLYIIMMVAIIITSITTYYGCILIPGASRNMATGLLDDRSLMTQYTNLNIGGFGFIYTLVLLLPGLYHTIRFRVSNFISRLFFLSVIILFYITLYKAEYTTAMLFSTIAIVILFLPTQLSTRSSIYIVLLTIPLVIVMESYLPLIFRSFAKMLDTYPFSVRMEEISVILEGGEGYGDAQSRINLWNLSWENFVNNIFTGTGTIGGGHSYILDTMSKFGLLGLILVILQFTALFKLFVKPYIKTNYHTLFLSVYIIHFFLCLFNTQFFYVVFLVFIPLYAKDYAFGRQRNQHVI